MLPVTLWVTENPQKTLFDVSWLLVGIGAFYLISALCISMVIVRRLAALSVLAGLLVIVYVPSYVAWDLRPQSTFLLEVYRNFPQIKNLSAHPNALAVCLLTCLPFYIGILLFSGRKIRALEWLFTASVVLMGLGFLFFSQSVGGWAGLAVAFLLLLLLRWRKIGMLVILVIGGILAYFLISGPPAVLQAFTFSEILEPLKVRSELWVRALYLIRKFPITGLGMGTYQQMVDTLYPLSINPPESIPHTHAHNAYLQMAVDLGLPGLAAWIFILIAALIAAWQVYCKGRERYDPWVIGLGAGLLATQVGLMVHGLVDNVALAFWPVWGLSIGCRRLLFQQEVTIHQDVQQVEARSDL
jgi:putative inorganic carbon (hco3(-)) transporter